MIFTLASVSAWQDTNLANRQNYTIDGSKITRNLTNYTLPVFLNSTNFNWTNVSPSGIDVCIVDSTDTIKLPIEIEYFNKTQQNATIWVKVPTVTATTNSKVIVYYNNLTSVSSCQNKLQTWDPNFKMVLHFKETSGNATDSTGVNNVSLIAGDVIQTQGSFMGNAWDFDSLTNTGKIAVNSDPSIQLVNNETLSCWVYYRANVGGGAGMIMDKNANGDYSLLIPAVSGVSGIVGGIVQVDGNTSVPTNAWDYMAFTYDGGTGKTWLNGVAVSNQAVTGNQPTSAAALTIGYRSDAPNSRSINGIFDECRISNITRNDAWIKADNSASRNQLLIAGTQETVPAAALPANITACGIISIAGVYDVRNNLSTATGDCIAITADNVLLHGNNFTLNGTGATNGVRLGTVLNVTVDHLNTLNFQTSYLITSSANVTIKDFVSNAASGNATMSTGGNNVSLINGIYRNTGGTAVSMTSTNNMFLTNLFIERPAREGIAVSGGNNMNANRITFNNTATAERASLTTGINNANYTNLIFNNVTTLWDFGGTGRTGVSLTNISVGFPAGAIIFPVLNASGVATASSINANYINTLSTLITIGTNATSIHNLTTNNAFQINATFLNVSSHLIFNNIPTYPDYEPRRGNITCVGTICSNFDVIGSVAQFDVTNWDAIYSVGNATVAPSTPPSSSNNELPSLSDSIGGLGIGLGALLSAITVPIFYLLLVIGIALAIGLIIYAIATVIKGMA